MHIRKSTKQKKPITELPHGRTRITCKGKLPEGIWIAKDEENRVMYLLNHAIMFFPLPSWGMELPLKEEIDLYKYRGDKFEDLDITVCEEAYEALKEFINDKDEFDHVAFLEKQSKTKELNNKTEENDSITSRVHTAWISRWTPWHLL